MRCAECGCFSETIPGWVALPSRDPDDDHDVATVVLLCPPCAARELGFEPLAGYT